MINDFEETKKRLSELAVIINEFTSEAVQLKVLDWVFKEWNISSPQGELTKPPVDKKKRAQGKKPSAKETQSGQSDKTPRPRSSGGRPGPGKMIDRLIGDGFFKGHQTISKITDFCKEKYAHVYEVTDFSPALGRAIRAGKLARVKNQDNQYEYFES